MSTTIFTCECGQTRVIPNAAKHEITRCDECQMEYKRRKARERYRRKKGLPLDYVPKARTKKGTKKGKKKKDDDLYIPTWPKPVEKKPPPIELTPEEEIAQKVRVDKLFSMFDDDGDDDW